MIPPKGFKAELYPLRHTFTYMFGLSGVTSSQNSTICTIAKNYKAVINADTITTNPHNANFDVETGAICNKMSILDKIKLHTTITLTEDAISDGIHSSRVMMMPIFNSFEGRLDSVDDVSTTTGAAALELTKDATQEDITPAFGAKLPTSAGNGDATHPVSSVNFTEVFGTLNMTTNVNMEDVPWAQNQWIRNTMYFTNKGAINSMHGRMRWITLTRNRPTVSIFTDKFVPRDVRRIMPYSYFGMLFHLPIDNDAESPYYSGAITTTKPHIGIKFDIKYHEWNIDNIQEMTTT